MKTQTKPHLTQEELQIKANELTKKYGCTVSPIEFIKDEEQIIGYIKTPSRMLKVRVLDMAVQGAIIAATTLLDAVLLREESDRRLSSEKEEDDDIYFGAALAAFSTIEILTNQFKKKIEESKITNDSSEETQILALLAFHSKFSLDVDNMTDDEIALAWNRLLYGLKKNGQYNP